MYERSKQVARQILVALGVAVISLNLVGCGDSDKEKRRAEKRAEKREERREEKRAEKREEQREERKAAQSDDEKPARKKKAQ